MPWHSSADATTKKEHGQTANEALALQRPMNMSFRYAHTRLQHIHIIRVEAGTRPGVLRN